MKSIIRSIDRFCYRHPRFGIPRLMLYIVIGNAIVYLLSLVDTAYVFMPLLEFDAEMILQGQIWRLVSFVFVPQVSGLLWVVISLYFYYFIGNALETQWGPGKFTIYYFSGLLAMIIYGFVAYFCGATVGLWPAYLNTGMFLVFATFYPDLQFRIFFIIPIKAKWIAVVDLIYFAIGIVGNTFPQNLLPVVILLHYCVFCGGWLFDLIHPENVKKRSKRRNRTVNFKREVNKINREQANAPYKRKCAVCGKTDTDYPQLEFRYCSQCDGYHCFCEEHIGNHVHFKDN